MSVLDHMAPFKQLFKNIHTPKLPIYIRLPNGIEKKKKHLHEIGTIKINEHMVLDNVLYGPDFHHNLLSILKLLSSSNLLFTFTGDTCLL